MAKKNQKRSQQREKAKQRREHRKNAEKAREPGPQPFVAPFVPSLPLDPPSPERCLPPIYLDSAGRVAEDPYAALGLPPGTHPEAAIQEAWRQTLRAHPPERDPEGARRAQDARQRLIDPARVLERELGVVRLPDPAAWKLEVAAETSVDPNRLSAADRLVGQALIYALLEDHLLGPGAPPAEQPQVFPAPGR